MLKKELPIIFIGLCVVVATLVLGWSIFVKQEVSVQVPVVNDKPVDNGNGEIIPDDDLPGDVSKIDTSDWKTYRSEKYGFEMKYPEEFELNDSRSGKVFGPYDSELIAWISKMLCCDFDFDNGINIRISYSSDKSKYPDMNDLLESKRKRVSKETFSVEKYSYKNFEGVKTISTDSEICKEERIELFLKTNDGFYSFWWAAEDPENRDFTYTNYLIPMLSTFKFTE